MSEEVSKLGDIDLFNKKITDVEILVPKKHPKKLSVNENFEFILKEKQLV